MILELDGCAVRSLRADDAPSLARHANNRKIWLNLRDAFPHPYTDRDGITFIRDSLAMSPECRFAIDVGGEAVGCIGFVLHGDVERVSSELGYWLSEEHWGKGITTQAVMAVTAYAIGGHGLTRVYAVPYGWNAASARVLEKSGYTLEGRMRRSAIKDGRVIDQLLYAFVVPEPHTGGQP